MSNTSSYTFLNVLDNRKDKNISQERLKKPEFLDKSSTPTLASGLRGDPRIDFVGNGIAAPTEYFPVIILNLILRLIYELKFREGY